MEENGIKKVDKVEKLTLEDSERQPCEIWTRVMGYCRPVSYFNIGKQGEREQRVHFEEKATLESKVLKATATKETANKKAACILSLVGIFSFGMFNSVAAMEEDLSSQIPHSKSNININEVENQAKTIPGARTVTSDEYNYSVSSEEPIKNILEHEIQLSQFYGNTQETLSDSPLNSPRRNNLSSRPPILPCHRRNRSLGNRKRVFSGAHQTQSEDEVSTRSVNLSGAKLSRQNSIESVLSSVQPSNLVPTQSVYIPQAYSLDSVFEKEGKCCFFTARWILQPLNIITPLVSSLCIGFCEYLRDSNPERSQTLGNIGLGFSIAGFIVSVLITKVNNKLAKIDEYLQRDNINQQNLAGIIDQQVSTPKELNAEEV